MLPFEQRQGNAGGHCEHLDSGAHSKGKPPFGFCKTTSSLNVAVSDCVKSFQSAWRWAFWQRTRLRRPNQHLGFTGNAVRHHRVKRKDPVARQSPGGYDIQSGICLRCISEDGPLVPRPLWKRTTLLDNSFLVLNTNLWASLALKS